MKIKNRDLSPLFADALAKIADEKELSITTKFRIAKIRRALAPVITAYQTTYNDLLRKCSNSKKRLKEGEQVQIAKEHLEEFKEGQEALLDEETEVEIVKIALLDLADCASITADDVDALLIIINTEKDEE